MGRLKVGKFYFTCALPSQIKPEPVSMFPKKSGWNQMGKVTIFMIRAKKLTCGPNTAHHLFAQIKFYWNTITLFHLRIVLWLLSPTRVELSSFEKDSMAHRAKDIYYLVFYRKSLLTLVQHDHRRPHTTQSTWHCSRNYDIVLFPNKVPNF